MAALPLNAPGVIELPATPTAALTGERMDIAAFVGVAPRGPAHAPVYTAPWAPRAFAIEEGTGPVMHPATPVVVESWTEYQRHFGAFEGPGLLPYAVASFFEQGGRRAWIVRVVHDDPSDPPFIAMAAGTIPGVTLSGGGAATLLARGEGTWGNGLRVSLDFHAPREIPVLLATPTELVVERRSPLGIGTLVRLTLPGGARVLRGVSATREEWRPEDGALRLRAMLDLPLPFAPTRVEVVEGIVTVEDLRAGALRAGPGRRERHERVGFSPDHPRFVAAVLATESELVWPHPDWATRALIVSDAALTAAEGGDGQFSGGADRYAEITPEDFFDPLWTPASEHALRGVHSLAEIEEVSLLAVPDLYSPGPLAEPELVIPPRSFAGPEFAPCVDPPPPPRQAFPTPGLEGLRLDPRLESDRAAIIELQQRVIELASVLRRWTVVLDVPPGLSTRDVLAWRGHFDAAFAAAYHPWVLVARPDDARDTTVSVPPSAIAAGIVAARELAVGVPYGPANVLAAGGVALAQPITDEQHDLMHPLGVNVYRRERDGVRLTGARTLSRDPQWRQLSVRRLVTMLERALERQMQWTVFEPHTTGLRNRLRLTISSFLGELWRAGAFRGASEAGSFFVRCDESTNPPPVVDAGQLVVEIGVAPAEPVEWIVFQLVRDGDGTVRARE